jgi:nucleoside-diphosphate-sugar epimerase
MTPRTAVVTGCAGFIGSHLSERLVAEGWRVIGIDAFTPYYDPAQKMNNLAALVHEPRFTLCELDLATDAFAPLLADRPLVFHLAAQAGVRASFGAEFTRYLHDNLLATQRVLEMAGAAGCPRVVWASSSSVYGDAATYPCREGETPTRPRSPYGATKRACEDLADIYRQGGLDTVGLRYFTVYGPRQRPDMAFRRLCGALLAGEPFPIYGDGSQSRDFTHVSDAVDATIRAGVAAQSPPLLNVGGGVEATLAEVVGILEELAGRSAILDRHPPQQGDVRRTSADTTLARTVLGWNPRVALRDGLLSELEWTRLQGEARADPLPAMAVAAGSRTG